MVLLLFVCNNTIFTEKTVDFYRIQTQIVEVEGKHADDKTTTSQCLTSVAKWLA